MRIANIDGDIPCYAIGFVTEEEPVSHALQTTKRFIEQTTHRAGCGDYQIYLTGKGNFRETIAVTKEYKVSRKGKAKPKHWRAIRDYMLMEKGAILCEGIEADDALGLNQTDNTVLCTVDKDLKMIAGWHYNWTREHLIEVSQDEADRFFFQQWLSGDSTDDIPGAKRIGVVLAERALEDCTSNHQMAVVVDHIYESKGHDEAYMEEMGHLIWMQRPDAITYKEWLDVD